MKYGLPMAKSSFLFQCVAVLGLLARGFECILPDEDVRARMEEKAISSISLRALEDMVEKQRYPITSPKFLMFRPQLNGPTLGEQLAGSEFSIRYADPVNLHHPRDYFNYPSMEIDHSPSEHIPSFHNSMRAFSDHPSYSTFWSNPIESRNADDLVSSRSSPDSSWEERDEPSGRQSEAGDDGCRTVVKKIKDPEDGNPSGKKVKSIIIEKECEYPKGYGPDAHIPGAAEMEAKAPVRELPPIRDYAHKGFALENKRLGDSLLSTASESDKTSKDPLAMDYIDKMFDTHFKSFPSFKFRTPSLEKQHERFTETLSHLEEKDHDSEPESISKYSGYGTHRETDEAAPFIPSKSSGYETRRPPALRKKLRHPIPGDDESSVYEAPVKKAHGLPKHDFRDSKPDGEEDSPSGGKSPKAMKKSFAYYRKDNPDDDPDNQDYAEEYAHGNFRSFSTSYDSDRDGPKKSS